MSALTQSLAASFDVSSSSAVNAINDPRKTHPRLVLYKGHHRRIDHNGRAGNGDASFQERRRQAALQGQKKRRDDYLMLVRSIVRDANKIEEEEEEEEGEVTTMEDEESAAKDAERQASKPILARRSRQLMLSEWLVAIPFDWPQAWLVRPTPEGKRCLVVAGRGETFQYARGGRLLWGPFPSLLPGGHRMDQNIDVVTMIDCVYEWTSRQFYVLDVMMWGDRSFYERNSQARFAFLADAFSPSSALVRRSHYNPYAFIPLPVLDAGRKSVVSFISSCATFFPVAVDGLLCYHRRVHYLPGRKHNPLVMWLKPYMIPELMGYDVPANVRCLAPVDYLTAHDFIAEYRDQHQKRRKKWKEEERQNGVTRMEDVLEGDADGEERPLEVA